MYCRTALAAFEPRRMGPSIPPIVRTTSMPIHCRFRPRPIYAPDINQALIEISRTTDYSARTTNITVMLTPAAAQRYVSSVCRR